MVGWLSFQRARLILILSITGDHTLTWSTLFPIHAPSILTGSPSPVIWMLSMRGSWDGWIQQVVVTAIQYSAESIGRTSVFPTLNLAPEAIHQASKIFLRSA